MSLPSKPQTRAGLPPRRARILLGAAAKVGKTQTLAEWAPATTLIVDTHNGTRFLDGEHFVSHVHDWQSFVSVVDDICRGGHMFHTVGLDLVNDLWNFCDLRFGTGSGENRIPASAADDYSRSRKRAQSAFEAEMARLLAAPIGVWFLTHLTPKTDKTGEFVKYAPDMDKTIYSFIAGRTDYIWLAEALTNGKRVVHTQPHKHFECGSRGSRDHPLPSPLPLDAGALALALDRSLNPHEYNADGKRKQAEPPPAPVEATERAADPPPPVRQDPAQTGGSDVQAEDPWWTDTSARITALKADKRLTGDDLRALVTGLGLTLPDHVSSWKAVLCGLTASHRRLFTASLPDPVGPDLPWEPGEDSAPDPDSAGGQLDVEEARAEAVA